MIIPPTMFPDVAIASARPRMRTNHFAITTGVERRPNSPMPSAPTAPNSSQYCHTSCTRAINSNAPPATNAPIASTGRPP
jgi:hypothetical protein